MFKDLVVLVSSYGALLFKDFVFVADFQKRTLLPWTRQL